tara:strand:+ start:113 stop:430 length:318 start_codon:yes stop_codon:yes gene_type:complete
VERKSSVWELLPSLFIVYLGINVIIEMTQHVEYFSQGGGIFLTIFFCTGGAAGFLTGGYMIFYGFRWARKVLRGEHTGAQLNLRLTATVDNQDEDPYSTRTSDEP